MSTIISFATLAANKASEAANRKATYAARAAAIIAAKYVLLGQLGETAATSLADKNTGALAAPETALPGLKSYACAVCGGTHGAKDGKLVSAKRFGLTRFLFNPSDKSVVAISDTCWSGRLVGKVGKAATAK